MPSHRAEKHRATSKGPVAVASRRRASTGHRRRSQVRPAAIARGAALVVAAAAAVTSSHLVAAGGSGTTVSAPQGGSAPRDRLSLAVASARQSDGHRASRSGSRPRLSDSGDTAGSSPAAARQVALRGASLRAAAADAQRLETKLAAQRAQRRANARAREAARKRAEAQASSGWVLPTTGFHISVWFGEAGPYWSTGYHTGIDFATAYGTPVVAVAGGTVAQTGWDGAYGNQIRLRLENGDEVWYNHLSAIEVSTGQSVGSGQELGKVGETGNAYGAHLHFEYRLASDLSTAVDPLPFFQSHGISLS